LQKRHGLCKKNEEIKPCSKHDKNKNKKETKIAHVQKKGNKERDGIIQRESIHLSTIFHPHTCTS
jgi:hypothetical protein